MRRLVRPKPILFLLVLIALVSAGAVAQHFRLFERAWFNLQAWRQPVGEGSIGLADYRVVLEAQVIEGLDSDVSALTFDPVRKSLFTVTNKNPELIELSLDGKILRRIALVGFGDAEAVEFISEGIYVISDERQQRLIKVHVDDDTEYLDAADAEQMTLGLHVGGNKGFEFRARLVREGRTVLRELGTELPSDVVVKVWDTSAESRYLVLPVRPEGSENMSEEALQKLVTKDVLIGVALPRVG